MNITESSKFAQMRRDYLTFSKQELDSLRQAVEQADFEQIHNVSHKIKGTAGTYQLTNISQAAERLQKTADDNNAPALDSAFNELYELIAKELQRQ